jgi:Lysylphosphatidylglycerol synthase TM region
VETPVDADLSRRPRGLPKWLVPVLGAIGLALLVYLIFDLGPARIASELQRLGSILPAVLLLSGTKYLLQTAGWRLVLQRPARPPWPESIGATITGDALGYLTWAGPFTGEPIRAVLIRESVPVAAGIAAGAIERTMYNLTAAGLVAAVLVGLLFATSPPGRAIAWVSGGLGAALILAIGARRWAKRRSRGHDRSTPADSPSASKPPPGRGRAAFRAAVKELWRERRVVLPALALLCLLQHALLVLEAYLMLGALGAAPSVWTAFIFEAVTKIVNTAGLLVPGRLGVSEGGSALLAGALGFAASYGLSLALMRRVRALLWAAVGLALLPVQQARSRRLRDKAISQRVPR